MGIFNKTFFKFTLGFIVIIAVAITLLYYVAGPKLDDEYDEQMQQAQQLEEAYKNDTYGGDTPEETLELFITALKAGDIDLASKYFVAEKQEEKREELATGKQSGALVLLIQDLEKERFGKELFEGYYKFTTYDENNRAEFSFDLVRNLFTKKWKIESL